MLKITLTKYNRKGWMNMELINEALIVPEETVKDATQEGLMCLDACKCIGDDLCETITFC